MSKMHPVYTAHAAELERLLYTNAGYLQKRRERGDTKSEDYRLMDRVQRRCADLLMRMIAEDDDVMLVNDDDFDWIRRACEFVRRVIDEAPRKAV